MSLWLQTPGTLYLPPSKPVAKVYNTDDYVVRTGYYFHAYTERLLLVGHPYFDVEDGNDKIVVPKVSAHQYRVFRLNLPDPNKFAIADACIFDPEKERLVWKLTGLQVDRGGPLGIGASGHPLFNKFHWLFPRELLLYLVGSSQSLHSRNLSHTYLHPVCGCAPPTGQYWDVTKPCNKLNKGDCPAIELLHTHIQDGDMCEIGFGNANFENFQQDRAGVPLEITNEICVWPDFLKMSKDVYGDQLFFYNKKEQLYARHYLTKAGIDGDALPPHTYLNPQDQKPQKTNFGPYSYTTTPSGSLVSSDANIFNRPYWLHKALGANNGILWGNTCFVTIVDNTRNITFNLSIFKEDGDQAAQDYKYKAKDFKNYSRHTEEYEIEMIVELCKIPLDPDVLAHINVMNPRILDEWELAFVPPPPQGIEDSYRYILSLATKCPADVIPAEKPDPWDKYTFWEIDMTEKLSAELSQFSLGKRFLYQSGLLKNKRIRDSDDIGETRRSVKRKRRN